MEETGLDPGSYPIPPASVHFAPFSHVPAPSVRRLSSNFICCRQPVQSSRRLAHISLQSLLVKSGDASSARSIGGGLSREETVAWELFTPYQRFLIVAVIGVAAAESKKNDVIRQLQKKVDLRDLLLSSMQQKLDDLCQELNLVKYQSVNEPNVSDHDDLQSNFKEKFGFEKVKYLDCGCWLCDQHHHSSPAIQEKAPTNLVIDTELEERRLSYMSDWCSSVTSAAEIHFENLSLDQDMLSLRKECQEKDATIKDLTSFLQLINKASPKQREKELEETVGRKNTIIKKLKRDVLVLEEKVTQLTRLQRSSYPTAISNTRDFPMKIDNPLYDIYVSTPSSSSSDSEPPTNTPRRTMLENAPPVEPSALEQTHKSAPTKSEASVVKPSSLSTNRKPVPVSSSSSSSKMRRASLTGDSMKPRRQSQVARRESSGSHKRWV